MISYVVNPAAGNGAARALVRRIGSLLSRAEFESELLVPSSLEDTKRLASEAAAGSRIVVAVGGDGTVHAVAGGLIAASRTCALGVVPVGTGNDFAKMLPRPRSIDALVSGFGSAEFRHVDYGEVDWKGGDHGSSHFLNAAGAGFDAQVSRDASALKYLPGPATAYLASVLRNLLRWTSPTAMIRYVSAQANDEKQFTGRLFLISVGNGTCVGGSFYLTPKAHIDDGQLDMCLVRHMRPARVLRVIPLAMAGSLKLLVQPEVLSDRILSAHVESERPLTLHADGEILSSQATRIAMRIVSGGLEVAVVPPQVSIAAT